MGIYNSLSKTGRHQKKKKPQKNPNKTKNSLDVSAFPEEKDNSIPQ